MLVDGRWELVNGPTLNVSVNETSGQYTQARSHGLNSYGLYSYGVYAYGVYGYGLYIATWPIQGQYTQEHIECWGGDHVLAGVLACIVMVLYVLGYALLTAYRP